MKSLRRKGLASFVEILGEQFNFFRITRCMQSCSVREARAGGKGVRGTIAPSADACRRECRAPLDRLAGDW